jgi:hypothetical protein
MMVCVFAVNLFGDRWTFQQVTAYMWAALALVCRARVLNREPNIDEATAPLEDYPEESLATCAV